MYAKIGVALKLNFMSSLLQSDVFSKMCIYSITLKILNLNNESPKIFSFDMLSP